jgi:hypothetical protein
MNEMRKLMEAASGKIITENRGTGIEVLERIAIAHALGLSKMDVYPGKSDHSSDMGEYSTESVYWTSLTGDLWDMQSKPELMDATLDRAKRDIKEFLQLHDDIYARYDSGGPGQAFTDAVYVEIEHRPGPDAKLIIKITQSGGLDV